MLRSASPNVGCKYPVLKAIRLSNHSKEGLPPFFLNKSYARVGSGHGREGLRWRDIESDAEKGEIT